MIIGGFGDSIGLGAYTPAQRKVALHKLWGQNVAECSRRRGTLSLRNGTMICRVKGRDINFGPYTVETRAGRAMALPPVPRR